MFVDDLAEEVLTKWQNMTKFLKENSDSEYWQYTVGLYKLDKSGYIRLSEEPLLTFKESVKYRDITELPKKATIINWINSGIKEFEILNEEVNDKYYITVEFNGTLNKRTEVAIIETRVNLSK